jgi:hypothetical protein
MKKYLDKFTVGGNPNEDHAMADQIFQGFQKKLPFPSIMAIIQRHGRQFAYETWNEIRQQKNVKNPVALFLYKVGKNKINFKKIEHGQ